MIYAVHRLYHAVPLLWRPHCVHHSHPDLDVTSAVRHHPLEYLSMAGIYWTAIVAIGIPGSIVAVHGLCVFALAALTHANVQWPPVAEQLLAPIIITLDAHLLHHNVDERHANSNFGAVLSVWDRIFGTYRQAVPAPAFGVRELDARDACSPTQMLLTPLRVGKMLARLVKAGWVEFAHSKDYYSGDYEFAVENFTHEFEELTRLEGLRLFPEDLVEEL
jgi:sterol desaturase/sphingolipid hydroxylase (fatty acid hydroxylase superfamily)